MPAALVVMLSLAAPPLVGIVCGLLCETMPPAEPAHHAEAVAHAHHGHLPGVPAADVADTRLVGEHVCDHGLGVVELYAPSGEQRIPLPDVAATADLVAGPHALRPLVTPWSQPLASVLGPPTRSPVLRI